MFNERVFYDLDSCAATHSSGFLDDDWAYTYVLVKHFIYFHVTIAQGTVIFDEALEVAGHHVSELHSWEFADIFNMASWCITWHFPQIEAIRCWPTPVGGCGGPEALRKNAIFFFKIVSAILSSCHPADVCSSVTFQLRFLLIRYLRL